MPEIILSDYFYGDEEEFVYFKIPRQLITNLKFKHVSTDAKLLYGMLLDRMSLSARNDWYDSDTWRVYIYYGIVDVLVGDGFCVEVLPHPANAVFQHLHIGDRLLRGEGTLTGPCGSGAFGPYVQKPIPPLLSRPADLPVFPSPVSLVPPFRRTARRCSAFGRAGPGEAGAGGGGASSLAGADFPAVLPRVAVLAALPAPPPPGGCFSALGGRPLRLGLSPWAGASLFLGRRPRRGGSGPVCCCSCPAPARTDDRSITLFSGGGGPPCRRSPPEPPAPGWAGPPALPARRPLAAAPPGLGTFSFLLPFA